MNKKREHYEIHNILWTAKGGRGEGGNYAARLKKKKVSKRAD